MNSRHIMLILITLSLSIALSTGFAAAFFKYTDRNRINKLYEKEANVFSIMASVFGGLFILLIILFKYYAKKLN